MQEWAVHVSRGPQTCLPKSSGLSCLLSLSPYKTVDWGRSHSTFIVQGTRFDQMGNAEKYSTFIWFGLLSSSILLKQTKPPGHSVTTAHLGWGGMRKNNTQCHKEIWSHFLWSLFYLTPAHQLAGTKSGNHFLSLVCWIVRFIHAVSETLQGSLASEPSSLVWSPPECDWAFTPH